MEPGLGPAAVAALLAERFPALFTPGQLKPLKLKIQADIQARLPQPVTRKVLSIVLQRHTTSTAYLRALSQATHRFDLDGQPAGEVAEEHRQAALAEVERRRAIVAERRAAERAAGREASKAAGQPVGPSAEQPTGHAGGERSERPDRREGYRPRGKPSRDARPPHAKRPPGGPAAPHPARQGNPAGQAPRRAPAPAEQGHQQREAQGAERAARATLLRAWETTTLTRANFCALKGLREAELEAMLAQAAQERDQRLAAAPKPVR